MREMTGVLNPVRGKRHPNTGAKHLNPKPLIRIVLRCCEDTDKNKSRVPIDGTAGKLIRTIRRIVKRLS